MALRTKCSRAFAWQLWGLGATHGLTGTHTHSYLYIYIYISGYKCVCIYIYIYTYIATWIYICVRMYIAVYLCVNRESKHESTSIHTYIYIYIQYGVNRVYRVDSYTLDPKPPNPKPETVESDSSRVGSVEGRCRGFGKGGFMNARTWGLSGFAVLGFEFSLFVFVGFADS